MNAIRRAVSSFNLWLRRLIALRPFSVVQWIFLAAMLAALGSRAVALIDGAAITADAAQNLQMAINLAHHDTISLDENAPYRPTMYREPLPVAIDAAMIRVEDRFLGATDATAYFAGDRARYVKYPNALWAALLFVVVLAATRWLSGSVLLGLVAGLYAVRPFINATSAEGVNDLYTELPGAVLLTCGSLALTVAVIRDRVALMALAGVSLGLATLTKAATLYVFIVLVALLAATWVARASSLARRRRGGMLLALIAAFFIIVAPWMMRNLADFGRLQISERGGLTLYTRALLDSMTPLEYRGSFYVWARPSWQARVGSLLGFSPRDLQPGGRLQRLSQVPGSSLERHDLVAQAAGRPQDAITFYYQARAMRVRLEQSFEQAGLPHPEVSADSTLQRMGLQRIAQIPGHHLALALALLWRGALTAFPVLLAALAYSLAARRHSLALYILPSMLTLCFYALLTHFEARPSLVVHGVEATALLVMLHAAWRFAWRTPHRAPQGRDSNQAAPPHGGSVAVQ